MRCPVLTQNMTLPGRMRWCDSPPAVLFLRDGRCRRQILPLSRGTALTFEPRESDCRSTRSTALSIVPQDCTAGTEVEALWY
eukprot:911418-Rhodomonas_salina.2